MKIDPQILSILWDTFSKLLQERNSHSLKAFCVTDFFPQRKDEIHFQSHCCSHTNHFWSTGAMLCHVHALRFWGHIETCYSQTSHERQKSQYLKGQGWAPLRRDRAQQERNHVADWKTFYSEGMALSHSLTLEKPSRGSASVCFLLLWSTSVSHHWVATEKVRC